VKSSVIWPKPSSGIESPATLIGTPDRVGRGGDAGGGDGRRDTGNRAVAAQPAA